MHSPQNIDLINQISDAAALLNKNYFKEQVAQKIGRKFSDLIQISEDPYTDRFGRATYLFVQLATTKIPFYQPGTICFTSAIQPESQTSAVSHGGSQQNGPILGMGCAVYLAKFMATLVLNFQNSASEENIENFDSEIYKLSLLQTLEQLASEDASSHGRLCEIKEWLLGTVSPAITLKPYEEQYFYLKELKETGVISSFESSEINNNKFIISSQKLQDLKNMKQADRLFLNYDQYFINSENLNVELFNSQNYHNLIEYLFSKKNIFENIEEAHKILQQQLTNIKPAKRFLGLKNNLEKSKSDVSPANRQTDQQVTIQKINQVPQMNVQIQQQPSQQFQMEDFSIPADFLKLKHAPKYLRRGVEETDQQYSERIGQFLSLLSQPEFIMITVDIDPSRQSYTSFVELTRRVMNYRLLQK